MHHFEVTLWSLWARLGSLWLHQGHFVITLIRFQKTLIFLIDFDDFIKHWGELVVTLGTLLAYEGDFGVTDYKKH